MLAGHIPGSIIARALHCCLLGDSQSGGAAFCLCCRCLPSTILSAGRSINQPLCLPSSTRALNCTMGRKDREEVRRKRKEKKRGQRWNLKKPSFGEASGKGRCVRWHDAHVLWALRPRRALGDGHVRMPFSVPGPWSGCRKMCCPCGCTKQSVQRSSHRIQDMYVHSHESV
ncbi:hypothetical protein B0I35DRAFT_424596 [Stachybotrys elegans]|uniref:Uncharacterized protein n=1 Tax=Stachybotrys elegans TaxID=80388 RepID=A0A8K0SZ70_9HYPO|nr:hypothetical protein B0I35DRAFT_424596 [Stachybotrys elegans]